MNKPEAERLAAAISMLRPDWLQRSTYVMLANPRLRNRPVLDVALALVAVALDPQSKTPGRVLEDGPWWTAARPPQAISNQPPAYEPTAPVEQLSRERIAEIRAYWRNNPEKWTDPEEELTA